MKPNRSPHGRTRCARILAESQRGGSVAEAAERLGMSPNAVRCMVARIRQRVEAGEPVEGKRVAHELAEPTPPAYAKLREWIDSHDMTVVAFAGEVGISVAALRLWRRARCVPSLAVAVRVEGITGIAPREWCRADFDRARGVD